MKCRRRALPETADIGGQLVGFDTESYQLGLQKCVRPTEMLRSVCRYLASPTRDPYTVGKVV
jgi:hypothetical protein